MNDSAMNDSAMNQGAPSDSSGAANPYPRPVPIPAFVRFLLAAFWTVGVYWACGFVYTLFPGHDLLPGVLYRIIACILTASGFLFFLRVLDYNPSPWPRALGLPLDTIGKRQVFTRLPAG